MNNGVSVRTAHVSMIRPALPQARFVTLEQLTLRAAEKVLIECALERADHNVRRAAVALGVSRSALYRKLQRHGIAPSQGQAR